ncbi:expressed unknown protein [Seminavis robusta]|uniref:Uncharacterized protein n=1 Tax=Seminavis robusta TaxID=568900 RepID=A0A9N8EH41_9STRA|nr:expressed unknown protein [Seminavis robusta]|eukprot:Sro1182_g250000.1 n/a (137) ;mRNA; r:27309-27719
MRTDPEVLARSDKMQPAGVRKGKIVDLLCEFGPSNLNRCLLCHAMVVGSSLHCLVDLGANNLEPNVRKSNRIKEGRVVRLPATIGDHKYSIEVLQAHVSKVGLRRKHFRSLTGQIPETDLTVEAFYNVGGWLGCPV